jgi:hypothetical protein
MPGIRTFLLALLTALVGACWPHHYTLPESQRADSEDRIQTAAFVVTPPAGSWVTGGVTIHPRGDSWSGETCGPDMASGTGASMVWTAMANVGEPIATLHLCHVSGWTVDLDTPSPHLFWQLSVYAVEDPTAGRGLSDEARAAAFVARFAETMRNPPTGYERFRAGEAAHFQLDFAEDDAAPGTRRQWATLRFSPELVIVYHTAHEPGPEWEDWIVFESLRPKR